MSQSSPFAAMRRLHERGSRSRGLVVDLAVEAALIKACFDTSQARDERGRWSSGGGIRVDEVAPVQIADAGEGMSDAGGILPAAANDQAAQPIPAPSATIPPPAQRSGNVSEYTPADAAKLPPPPVGSKYLTLADGSVPWTAPYHEIKGGAILVPNTVSIEDNVRAGEKILGDYNKALETDAHGADGDRLGTMMECLNWAPILTATGICGALTFWHKTGRHFGRASVQARPAGLS